MRTWYRDPRVQRLFDAGLTFVVTGPLLLASVMGALGERHTRGVMVVVAVAFGLLQGLPLLWRRRHPVRVFALSLAGSIALQLLFGLKTPPIGLIVALGSLASYRPVRETLVAAGLTVAVLLPDLGFRDVGSLFRSGFLVGLVAMAWTMGDAVQVRRREVEQLQERAETAEREREERAARAVAEEQARIARELHDVIAHNVSVMVVQAAAAGDVFDQTPERAREALRAIEASGREAMAELRRLLGAVRPAAGGEREYQPQPGLDRLDGLVAQVRAAGLPVVVTVEGAPRPLPAGIDLSAYRIVQEALTNALRHARAARATVTLRYGPSELGVEVVDDGVGGHPNGNGHGIVGMRERAALLGGTLDAGPARPAGTARRAGPTAGAATAAARAGFAVRARLPLQEAAT